MSMLLGDPEAGCLFPRAPGPYPTKFPDTIVTYGIAVKHRSSPFNEFFLPLSCYTRFEVALACARPTRAFSGLALREHRRSSVSIPSSARAISHYFIFKGSLVDPRLRASNEINAPSELARFLSGMELIDFPLRAAISPAHPLARRDVPVGGRGPSNSLNLDLGSGQGCPLLRASNEHIPLVRVLRARRAPGRSFPSFRRRAFREHRDYACHLALLPLRLQAIRDN